MWGPDAMMNVELFNQVTWNFPDGASGKELECQCSRRKRHKFDPWVGKIPWRRKWQPAPVFFPGKLRGQRSLQGYGPWGCKELYTTEWLSTHTHTQGALCDDFMYGYIAT